MADITAATWSQTDADNDAASPEGAPEGMSPGGLNNTMRMMMGALKRAYVWAEVPTTTAGTSTAYTLTYDVAPSALVDGMPHLVQFNATCGASPTLNVNSLGAKPLHYFTGTAWAVVPSGFIKANMVCPVVYNSSAGTYRIVSFPSAVGTATLAGDNAFTGANTFSGTLTMSGKAINEAARVDVASAATCDIGAAASNYVRITGTTTITGLGTVASGVGRDVVFSGALTLTHNATSLILPEGANITTAAGDTAIFRSEGSGNWRCISFQKASGKPLIFGQIVSTETGAVATGTTLMPWDDTIPQKTEGDEYMTLAITPVRSTSKLLIEVVFNYTTDTVDIVSAGLFQDTTANALAAAANWTGAANLPGQVILRHTMDAGTTSSTTFKVRAGPNSGGTTTFNGVSGTRRFGGVSSSSITIQEIPT